MRARVRVFPMVMWPRGADGGWPPAHGATVTEGEKERERERAGERESGSGSLRRETRTGGACPGGMWCPRQPEPL